MLKHDPRTRHLRQVPDAVAGSEQPPSRAAQQRLTGALRDRADAYRADATVDLTLVDVLVRMDQVEAAAQTLDDHRASLQAMAHDLAVVVAEAAVEREAEAVYDTCLRQLHRRTLPVEGIRRRLVALTGAAAVFVALLLPSTRIVPRTMLAGFENRVTQDEVAAARSRLDGARSTAQAVRDARSEIDVIAPAALRDPAVRRQVRAILADGTRASASAPDGVTVLATMRNRAGAASQHGTGPAGDERNDLAPVVPLRVNESAPSTDAGQLLDDDAAADAASPTGELRPTD